MSCSSKYEKLVEYIKTQREVYANIIGFVDSLESEEVSSNFSMPDINLDTLSIGTAFDDPKYYASIDNIDVGYASSELGAECITFGSDTLAAGPINVPGGMGEDHISFAGISTVSDEIFTVPSPLDELTGLNITTDKDDK